MPKQFRVTGYSSPPAAEHNKRHILVVSKRNRNRVSVTFEQFFPTWMDPKGSTLHMDVELTKKDAIELAKAILSRAKYLKGGNRDQAN